MQTAEPHIPDIAAHDAGQMAELTADLAEKARELAASMPELLSRARKVAATVTQGLHGRKTSGRGDSFWQYRRFEQSDDASRIDWRRSARTLLTLDELYRYGAGSLHVRQNEWDAAQTVCIWCDLSASMFWRYQPRLPEKASRACLLSLSLADMLLRGGERVGLIPPFADSAMAEHAPLRAHSGKNGLDAIAARLVDYLAHAPVGGLPPVTGLPPYAHIVVISDCFNDPARFMAPLKAYADRGIKGLVVQLTDPAERDFPFKGHTLFRDTESGKTKQVENAAALAKSYHRRFENLRLMLRHSAQSMDWSFLELSTDKPVAEQLMQLYVLMSDRQEAHRL